MIPLSRVKTLCTVAEVKLVKTSRPPELQRLSAARISQLSSQARKAFDKWQDLARKQTREQGRKTGVNAEHERTQEKVTIFRETLDQLREQFDKLKAAPAAEKAGKKPARGKVAKPARAAQARSSRASIRAKLSDKQTEMNITKKAARLAKPATAKPKTAKPTKAAAKKAVAKEVAPAASSSQPAAAPASTTAKKKKPARKSRVPAIAKTKPKRSGLIDAAKAQPQLAISSIKNMKAKTAAKQRAIAKSGQTQVQAHIMARGQRRQARRDSVNNR
jgi:hypothetical protein